MKTNQTTNATFFLHFSKKLRDKFKKDLHFASEDRVFISNDFSLLAISLIILKSQPGRLRFLAPETFAKFSTQKSVNFELLISMKYLAFPGPLSSTTLTVRQESVADTQKGLCILTVKFKRPICLIERLVLSSPPPSLPWICPLS